MKNGFKIMDSDMHMQEPTDLFEKYLDPAFRHRITSAGRKPGGRRVLFLIDGEPTAKELVVAQYDKTSLGTNRGVSDRADSATAFAAERGYDNVAQLQAMDMEGVDVAAMFPTEGLYFLARDEIDLDLELAICQTYNNWLFDFCKADQARLKGVAMVPLHDVGRAIQEAKRATKELGFVGVYMRPNEVGGRYWHSNYWDQFYDLLEDLNVPLCLHEGTGAFYSRIEPRFGEARMMRHVAGHAMEQMLACLAFILGGVFEFHSRLRVAFFEANCGWLPFWLERMERDTQDYGSFEAPYLSLTPKEYFQRNCWVSCEAGESMLPIVSQYVGEENLVYSTDFPHYDSEFPHATEELIENQALSEQLKRKILWDNCARLYNLA